MKENFSVILVRNGDVIFEVPSLNAFDQSTLGFCPGLSWAHFPNLKSQPSILGSSLTIKLSCIIS